MARDAISVIASALLGLNGAVGFGDLALVLVDMMSKMADLSTLLVLAIASSCPPNELEGQHREQEDHQSFSHRKILAVACVGGHRF